MLEHEIEVLLRASRLCLESAMLREDPDVRRATQVLRNCGLIGEDLNITEKGAALVKYFTETPLPTPMFVVIRE